jgi:mannobiose 2-epimerase
MKQQDLKQFSERVSNQLFGHILPFWAGPALDRDKGGWMAWLSNDLKPDRSQPKGLIVNSRILWAFSAVHRARPETLYRQMADRAYEFVTGKFWDTKYGGAFWRLNDDGEMLDNSKKIYGQAFYIYALAEYYRAFALPEALEQAIELFEFLERHAHDSNLGGYWEVCRRDWSEAAASRLSDKDMNEKKSMNNHLHVLEAYTNLYRVWKDSRVAERLRELISLFQHRILDSHTGHFHHFFDDQWRVRSNTYTFGHDIEGSWLLSEAADELGDRALSAQVKQTALRMADTTLKEGLETDGGLCYEGKAGATIDRGKECWPQAEAVTGFLNAFQLSGEARFIDASRRVWDYIEQHLVDRVHGEWFWRINPDGKVAPDLPKVSEWKGPYHGSRACLEALHRLESIASS